MSNLIILPATEHSLPPLSRHLVALAQTVVAWELRHRSRQSLAKLAVHQLRDIGLDPLAASTEAAKPFWRD